jgi:hypothetical protein
VKTCIGPVDVEHAIGREKKYTWDEKMWDFKTTTTRMTLCNLCRRNRSKAMRQGCNIRCTCGENIQRQSMLFRACSWRPFSLGVSTTSAPPPSAIDEWLCVSQKNVTASFFFLGHHDCCVKANWQCYGHTLHASMHFCNMKDVA